MTFKEIALALDAQEKHVEAAWAYEIAINDSDAEFELFMNLAVLYFVCRDFGYASYHHLAEEFFSMVYQRSLKILELAESRFGSQTEILFWREYFSFIYTDNDKIDKVCEDLIQKGDSLIPYIFLLSDSRKVDYEEKSQKLLDIVKDGKTERERYIRSVLD